MAQCLIADFQRAFGFPKQVDHGVPNAMKGVVLVVPKARLQSAESFSQAIATLAVLVRAATELTKAVSSSVVDQSSHKFADRWMDRAVTYTSLGFLF